MRVVFIRHAEAVEAEDFKGPDLDRPLTKQGRKSARNTFQRLAAWFGKPDKILSSEALRAEDTARILAKCLGSKKPVTTSFLNPGSTARQVKKLLSSLSRRTTSIVLVGHEPDISAVVSDLVGDGHLNVRVKKGSCIEVDVDERFRGVLRVLLSPDIFEE